MISNRFGVSLLASLLSVSLALGSVALAATTDFRIDLKWIVFAVGACLVAWAGALLIRHGSRRLHKAILALYGGLLALGYWSFSMLVDYKAMGYPIAIFQELPTSREVRSTIARDVLAGSALLYGFFLARGRPTTDGGMTRLSSEGSGELIRLAQILFIVGTASAGVLVAATGRVAFFATDVDQVRYSQGAGLGFVTLLQYVLVPCIVLSVAAASATPARRPQAALLAASAATVLLLTRAERTPLLLALLGCLIFAGTTTRRLTLRAGALLAISAVGFVFVLGLFRFESQSIEVTADERTVRSVFDVSPELRERTYAYKYYGEEVAFEGPAGVLPLALSVVPGRVLGLVGVSKEDVYTDSSRQYSAAMRAIGLYTQPKPLRVGLQGELWMYGGYPVLLAGMCLYGLLVGRLASSRPRDAISTVTVSVAGAYAVVALITPLAALAPIVLASLTPLIIRRLL